MTFDFPFLWGGLVFAAVSAVNIIRHKTEWQYPSVVAGKLWIPTSAAILLTVFATQVSGSQVFIYIVLFEIICCWILSKILVRAENSAKWKEVPHIVRCVIKSLGRDFARILTGNKSMGWRPGFETSPMHATIVWTRNLWRRYPGWAKILAGGGIFLLTALMLGIVVLISKTLTSRSNDSIVLRLAWDYWFAAYGSLAAFTGLVIISVTLLIHFSIFGTRIALKSDILEPLSRWSGGGSLVGLIFGLLVGPTAFALQKLGVFDSSSSGELPIAKGSILALSSAGLIAGFFAGVVRIIVSRKLSRTNLVYSTIAQSLGSGVSLGVTIILMKGYPERVMHQMAKMNAGGEGWNKACNTNELYTVDADTLQSCISLTVLEGGATIHISHTAVLIAGCIVFPLAIFGIRLVDRMAENSALRILALMK
ncbi:MAG: hypothetical protein ACTIJJ_08975 [Galactobacter sp.]|uniref:hypothetical protein n=1 Tax=Galactobacter sp. TaxID=2676125 RepID=UPI0025BA58B5|nr:hypothetical protein [Galactobacter sp.]